MHRRVMTSIVLAAMIGLASIAAGDTFTFVDADAQTQTLEGAFIASGQGVHVLQQSDGQYVVVPQSQLQSRMASNPPVPLTVDEMADVLREKFGDDRMRILVDAPFVIGLVLAGPLPDQSEQRAGNFLRRAARFMQNVESVFSKFCRELRFETVRPEHPLVMLIFETDRDFNRYAKSVNGGEGLAVENMAGFYSPLSNWLAIRIGECRSFQVPLHEAIHQQVYNRGLLQRLAGVPVWFNEGIATGFENDGERINIGPTKINTMYARMVPHVTTLDWHDMLVDDAVFSGSVLAGEAYVHAWSMHWLLVTQHRREYVKYFQRLGQIAPLKRQTAAEREQQFVDIFGKNIAELHADFPRQLKADLTRQKIRLADDAQAPNVTYGDASEVRLTTIQRVGDDGPIEVQGELTNISPFRKFAYYVTVQTDGGLYAHWHLPCVQSLSSQHLRKRLVERSVEGSPGRTGETVWVDVTCALPESDEAEQWRRGEFPSPVWEGPAG